MLLHLLCNCHFIAIDICYVITIGICSSITMIKGIEIFNAIDIDMGSDIGRGLQLTVSSFECQIHCFKTSKRLLQYIWCT